MITRILTLLFTIGIFLIFVAWFASKPESWPKKTKNFFWAIIIDSKSTLHNFFAVAKLMKRRGAKAVFRRYPKTVETIFFLLVFAVVALAAAVVILIVFIYAGLVG